MRFGFGGHLLLPESLSLYYVESVSTREKYKPVDKSHGL